MQAPPQSKTGTTRLGNHGFTLIEMIVVTALISIMLVVAIPRLQGGLFSDGGDDTARWIIATVRGLKEKRWSKTKPTCSRCRQTSSGSG